MNIFFRVTLNNKIGFGHFSRISALASNLPKKMDYKIILDNKKSIKKLQLSKFESDFIYKNTDQFKSQKEDAKLFISKIKKNSTVIVDDYRLGYEWEKIVSKKAKRIVSICDNYKKRHYSDILINTKPELNNINKKFLKIIRQLNKKKCIFLLGHKYAIIPFKKRKLKNSSNNFNITFYNGGSGNPLIFLKLIKHIIKNNQKTKIKIHLIIGNLVKDINKIFRKYKNLKKVKLIHKKDIWNVLRNSNILFSSAGLMFYEASYLRIPSIFFQMSKNQKIDNETAWDFGHIMFLGKKKINELNKLNKIVITIMQNYKRISKFLRKPKFYIDGKGTKRILEKILD